VIGLEGVRRARALTDKPLVAIGGITRETAAAVYEAGADSVAVIGAIFGAGSGQGRGAGQSAKDFLENFS
jgi:thiamine-phosphate pyrophosphorylase